MRPGEEDLDGPPIHGNTKLEIIWTALPAILLVSLVAYAYVVLTDIEEAQAGSMKVRVVGEQFLWTYYYPSPEGGGQEVAANQLYLPRGKQVEFQIQSKDVIHDFWVPAFRMKIDAVPGVITDYRVTPNRKGDFPVVCAELCGLGHAYMRQTARVLDRPAFDAQLRRLRAGGGTGAASNAPGQAGQGGDQAAEGRQVFIEQGCGGCHALADAGTSGTTGPALDDSLENVSAEEIREAIVDPNADVQEGYQPNIMPSYRDRIPPEQLDALVDYLEESSR